MILQRYSPQSVDSLGSYAYYSTRYPIQIYA